jgi:hypothetical protein
VVSFSRSKLVQQKLVELVLPMVAVKTASPCFPVCTDIATDARSPPRRRHSMHYCDNPVVLHFSRGHLNFQNTRLLKTSTKSFLIIGAIGLILLSLFMIP